MPYSFILPPLAETTAEGTVGRWQKQPGDRVKRYEPLVDIMTDKVNVEMTSPVTGVISEINAPEGVVVPVGGLLATIIEDVEATAAAPQQGVSVSHTAATGPAPVAADPAMPSRGEGRQRMTPVVARLALEHGIDVSLINGSGIEGRVTKQDILDFVERRAAQPAHPAAVAATPPAAPPARTAIAAGADEEAIPLSPVRRAIAEHMAASKATIPHAWTMVEVDVTPLVRLREGLKEDFRKREGVDLTYLPFVMKALAETLKEFPLLNASWGGDKIILKKRINLGIAVNRGEDLIVPVIRDADRLSVAGLAHAIADLITKARANTLTPADISGGTFTMNNTGALGVILSYPIVYPGQAAILTSEAIIKRPVVVDDAIAIRSMMNMCLSFDHRIMDGGISGGFMRAMKGRLEKLGPETAIY